jgi:hypothetical protein
VDAFTTATSFDSLFNGMDIPKIYFREAAMGLKEGAY